MTKEDFIQDFISGQEVKSTSEKIESIQVFSKQLVEKYNYPKNHIRTLPNFTVEVNSHNTKKEYPIDIAIFSNEKQDQVFIIVDCTEKNKKNAINKLEELLKFSKANYGVWFTENEKAFIRKIQIGNIIKFQEISNIPNFSKRIQDITQSDKKIMHTSNLKDKSKSVAKYLFSYAITILKNKPIAKDIINIISYKMHAKRIKSPFHQRSKISTPNQSDSKANNTNPIINEFKSLNWDIANSSEGYDNKKGNAVTNPDKDSPNIKPIYITFNDLKQNADEYYVVFGWKNMESNEIKNDLENMIENKSKKLSYIKLKSELVKDGIIKIKPTEDNNKFKFLKIVIKTKDNEYFDLKSCVVGSELTRQKNNLHDVRNGMFAEIILVPKPK